MGLHIRPAKKFTELASKYKSHVFLVRGDMRVNAKSIMGVVMLAAGPGSKLTLECDGEDEVEACNQLVALIDNKFGEE